jgi:hypothetical protein
MKKAATTLVAGRNAFIMRVQATLARGFPQPGGCGDARPRAVAQAASTRSRPLALAA